MVDFTSAPGAKDVADVVGIVDSSNSANPGNSADSADSPDSADIASTGAGDAGQQAHGTSVGKPTDDFLCARERALELLRVCDPYEKASGVTALRDAVLGGQAIWHPERRLAVVGESHAQAGADEREAGIPGRPVAPRLVSPRELKQRAVTTLEGRAALLHALAHIEFNAINLALDALWRFDGLPVAYYDDWLQVAAEEAYHFSLLAAHLKTLGDAYDYGCFPAHDGLWDMARRTSGDWLARLALVPRTLEARGLDASLPIKAKLSSAGDKAGAAILDIILRDEIGHVAIGNRWYRWGCERAGVEPVETYARLAAQYGAPRLRGPFNLEARRAAGFDEAELAALQAGE